MTRLLQLGQRSAALAAFALLAPALLAGCPGEQNGPKDPSEVAQERRATEMVHEDCDLQSSSAVAMDANGDGKPDLIKVMSGQRETCRAVDINMDGIIDVFVYYGDDGQVRRRESGFDRDARPDEVSHFQGGVLVRKERETNNDGQIDTWDYYEGGRLVREERDSTGDGYIDQWWTFSMPDRPECAVVVSDNDGDGKPDEGSQIDLCKDAAPPGAAPAAEKAKEAGGEPAEGEEGTGAGEAEEQAPEKGAPQGEPPEAEDAPAQP